MEEGEAGKGSSATAAQTSPARTVSARNTLYVAGLRISKHRNATGVSVAGGKASSGCRPAPQKGGQGIKSPSAAISSFCAASPASSSVLLLPLPLLLLVPLLVPLPLPLPLSPLLLLLLVVALLGLLLLEKTRLLLLLRPTCSSARTTSTCARMSSGA